MTNSSRVPAGVPAGGQFAASARSESTVALNDGVHRLVEGVDDHRTCPLTWGEKCREHRNAPGPHVGDMEILACEEDEDRNVYPGVAENEAEFFTLYSGDADGTWMAVEDYPSREEARAALAEALHPNADQAETEQAVEVLLADAIGGYRMNHAAVRTALDAYSEAIEAPGASANEAQYRARLAERERNMDMAALCLHSSVEALRPHLNSDERLWADRLAAQVNDPNASSVARANCARTVIGIINVGRLERERLRQRALDPDDQVFGADRAETARITRHELAQAQAAYEAAGGGWAASDAVIERLNRAKQARAKYAEYVD